MDESTRDADRIADAPGTRSARVLLWAGWALLVAWILFEEPYVVVPVALPAAVLATLLSIVIRPSRGAALLLAVVIGWFLIDLVMIGLLVYL